MSHFEFGFVINAGKRPPRESQCVLVIPNTPKVSRGMLQFNHDRCSAGGDIDGYLPGEWAFPHLNMEIAVSYTHLTLPTILLV